MGNGALYTMLGGAAKRAPRVRGPDPAASLAAFLPFPSPVPTVRTQADYTRGLVGQWDWEGGSGKVLVAVHRLVIGSWTSHSHAKPLWNHTESPASMVMGSEPSEGVSVAVPVTMSVRSVS